MFLEMLFYTFSLILTLLFFLYGFNHYFLLNARGSIRSLPCLPNPGSPNRLHPITCLQ